MQRTNHILPHVHSNFFRTLPSHPPSFDIHPQNTRGWGTHFSIKNFVSSLIDRPSLLFSASALRPLPPLLPLTPLHSALTKNRGEGPPPDQLRTNSFPKWTELKESLITGRWPLT